MEGYIKLHRKFLEWEWYQDINTKTVFLHLLISANYKPSSFRGAIISRGQYVTSNDKLSENLGLTINEVRTALKHLKKSGEIDTQSTNRYTVVTVRNYDIYQGISDEEPQANDNQITGKAQAINKRLTTSKEGKKSKKVRKEEIKDIVLYLNKKAGTDFNPETQKTISLITSRLNDGLSADDLKRVIDIKCAEWLGDPKMSRYLRPSTLFGPKCEEYLNQKESAAGNAHGGYNSENPTFDIDVLTDYWNNKNGIE